MSGDQHAYFGTAPGRPYTTHDGIVEQGVTEVDVESIASAVKWLDDLKAYVQTHLIPDTSKMVITQGDAELWFGKLDASSKVSGMHSSYVDTVIKSYQSVAQSLDAASRATANIVQNYRDAEHNNTLTAQKIEAAFAGAAQGPSNPSGGNPSAGAVGTGNVSMTQSSVPISGTPTGGRWQE